MEMNRKERMKAILTGLATVLILTGLLIFLFRDNADELLASLGSLSCREVLFLAGLGLWYQVLDSLICYTLVSPALPSFTFRQAAAVTLLGVFGNVSTLAAGTVPLQSCYLSRCGLMAGRGVGIMTLEYVFHKSSVLIFATILLLWQGAWLKGAIPGLTRYIWVGYSVCLLVISALILLCTWNRAQQLLLWLIGKLPNTGTWGARKHNWSEQIEALYRESRDIISDKSRILRVLGLNLVKLFSLCAIPWFCMILLDLPKLSLLHSELLTSLMYLISNALPNLAGVGPTEFAFLMLYTPLLGHDLAPSVLLLYRISTYYIPFLVSVLSFLLVQRTLLRGQDHKSEQDGA